MRQERQGADGVIAAAAPGAEQHHLGCSGIERGEEGELGIGRVLIRWEARDGHAGRLQFVDVASVQRIKIADHLVQSEAERSGMSGATIGSDHQSGVAPSGPMRIEQRRVGSIAPRKNQRAHRYLALYRAGYTCVLPSPA